LAVNLGLWHLWKFKLASDEQQQKRAIQLYSQRRNNARQFTTKELISIEVTFLGHHALS
jgi:hypothetical protein